VEFWKVFPVLLYYPELRPTRRAQYGNCGVLSSVLFACMLF